MEKKMHVTGSIPHIKWKSGCTDRVNRLRDQYWKYPPAVDIEWADVYTRIFKQTEAEDMTIRKALALKTYCDERTIQILPSELIVGTCGKQPRSAVLCPDICWDWIKAEIDTMDKLPQNPYIITEKDHETLRKDILPLCSHLNPL